MAITITKEQEAAIAEYEAYTKEIEALNASLKALKAKAKNSEAIVAEVVKDMEEHGEKIISTKDAVLTIKRKSHDKLKNPSYAKLWATALTKLNDKTQKVLVEIKEEADVMTHQVATFNAVANPSKEASVVIQEDEDDDLAMMKALAKESVKRHAGNIDELLAINEAAMAEFIETVSA